jgi:hypothetical protein
MTTGPTIRRSCGAFVPDPDGCTAGAVFHAPAD